MLFEQRLNIQVRTDMEAGFKANLKMSAFGVQGDKTVQPLKTEISV